LRIEHTFTVSQPPPTVFTFFQDVPVIADCLPGAELMEDLGNGTYRGKVSTKVGPISASFEGEAVITSDSEGNSGLISGKGIDKKGGSRGAVEVRYQIEPNGSGSVVNLTADLSLAGAIAQFGRTGLINEMSNTLIGRFTECLEAKLAASSSHEAAAITAGQVNGFGLFLKSLWPWVRNRLRRILPKS